MLQRLPGRQRAAADHQVTGQTNKIYPLLNQYSPEFSCLFQGINHLYTLAGQAIYNNQIHLSATVDNQNLGPYKPGNQPKLVTGLGPNCFGLPQPAAAVPDPGQVPLHQRRRGADP